MPYHTPARKIEQAFKAMFQQMAGEEFAGAQWLTRFDGTSQAEPRVEIISESQKPWSQEGEITGSWDCRLLVRVVSHYERNVDGETHDTLAGEVVDLLMRGADGASAVHSNVNACNLGADVSARQYILEEIRQSVDGHSYVTEIEGRVLMAVVEVAD